MIPVIFIHNIRDYEEEIASAKEFFHVVHNRVAIPRNSLVIPRYSALPFNKELCEDVRLLNGEMINSHRQHSYLADLANWYFDFEGVTPHTWFNLSELPNDGPFVLKGQTNSRKQLWSTHMFARDKREAIEVYRNLSTDGLIGEQNIYIRKYVPLVRLDTGLNGLPISEEYRFFVLDGEIVDSGFYWATHPEVALDSHGNTTLWKFAGSMIQRVGKNARFWVMDIAKTETGDWTVVELNDGQQSGLSTINPKTFYSNLSNRLTTRK